MKTKLCLVFVLAAGLTAYAQHGRPAGVPASGPPMTPGASPGQMPRQPGEMPPDIEGRQHPMSEKPDAASRPEPVGKQAPDVILQRDSQLATRLGGMLPNGMTAQQGCSGFRNLGECVAAIHVSQNLGIPFNELK